MFPWIARAVASSSTSSSATPCPRKKKESKDKNHLISKGYEILAATVLTSIFSFLAMESQSFAAIPILQSRLRLITIPFSKVPAQKHAR